MWKFLVEAIFLWWLFSYFYVCYEETWEPVLRNINRWMPKSFKSIELIDVIDLFFESVINRKLSIYFTYRNFLKIIDEYFMIRLFALKNIMPRKLCLFYRNSTPHFFITRLMMWMIFVNFCLPMFTHLLFFRENIPSEECWKIFHSFLLMGIRKFYFCLYFLKFYIFSL